ncbi:MAG: beta-N-acetylhexosaminidase [Gammaproteobacteria bacterium]|nr:beta-N-acetylhexosaminidase [Gammaproteobacteria bacterium]MYD76157.1 beta-N-acetylhexosaminidase [Gammaproteobacteria bacterium]MYJ51350.1 beta-N-acetylhexosaminidase [Gammaproteobacteria bacterium]
MPELSPGPLIVDIPGESLEPGDIALLKSPAVGGVILFSRNYRSREHLAELIREIKAVRNPPLLVCTDQEGGRVQRFRDGFFPLPAARTIGLAYEKDMQQGLRNARSLGKLMAGELIESGLDLSFAPVLDCAHPESQVIGDRSFSADPNVVTALAGAFIHGMNAAGMAATGKHYPGHGGVKEDSHDVQPVDRRDLQTLLEKDLVPFRRLAGQLAGMMTAHVQFVEIDSALPTFSIYWLDTVLRHRIGFEGIVFSDDLTMSGAEQGGKPVDRAHAALGAGCDMILVCNDREAALEVSGAIGEQHVPDPAKLGRLYSSKRLSSLDLAVLRAELAD